MELVYAINYFLFNVPLFQGSHPIFMRLLMQILTWMKVERFNWEHYKACGYVVKSWSQINVQEVYCPLALYGIWGSRKTSWDGPANKKVNTSLFFLSCHGDEQQDWPGTAMGSSVDSSAPTILRSWVRIPITPSVLFPFIVDFPVLLRKGWK